MASDRLQIEACVRNHLNAARGTSARKSTLAVGLASATHEFDIFQEENIIGGISTSPWTNRTRARTTNTGGQDRVTAELLWLSLWSGPEERILVLTDSEMAEKIHGRFEGCSFPHRIEILYFDLERQEFVSKGILGVAQQCAPADSL